MKKNPDVIVGTKEQSLWQKVKRVTEERIQQLKDDLEINEEMLKLANKKIKGIFGFNLTHGKKK